MVVSTVQDLVAVQDDLQVLVRLIGLHCQPERPHPEQVVIADQLELLFCKAISAKPFTAMPCSDNLWSIITLKRSSRQTLTDLHGGPARRTSIFSLLASCSSHPYRWPFRRSAPFVSSMQMMTTPFFSCAIQNFGSSPEKRCTTKVFCTLNFSSMMSVEDHLVHVDLSKTWSFLCQICRHLRKN